MRSRVSDVVWRLSYLCGRHLGVTVLAVALCWSLSGIWMAVSLAAFVALMLGSDDRLRRSSSLAQAVKFGFRRAYIRMSWHRTMKAARLEEPRRHHGLPDVMAHPRLLHAHWWQCLLTPKRWVTRIQQTPTGLQLTVDGTELGLPHTAFEGASGVVIQSRNKAHDLIVTQHPKWGWLTQMTLVYVDPFKRVIRLSELTTHKTPGTVNIGKDTNGAQVAINMLFIQLIVGASRSGKSSICWTILQGLLEQGISYRLRVCDPKGGMEFFDLDGKAYVYECDILKCGEFLKTALFALMARQAEMKAAGVRKWLPEHANRWPLDIMLIDELITFVGALKGQKITINRQKMDATDLISWYLTQGLAAGFTVIANVQDPKKETIAMRSLFSSITLLRVADDDEVRMAGFKPELHPAHQFRIGDKHAGRAYMKTDFGVVKFRAAYPDDNERAATAKGVLEQSQIHWATDNRTAALPEEVFEVPEELMTNGAKV